MTTGPGIVDPPAHPLPALTTYELRDYRCQLELALTALPSHAETRDLVQARLAEVVAEQDSRTRAAAGLP